jgi:hypothetical protein
MPPPKNRRATTPAPVGYIVTPKRHAAEAAAGSYSKQAFFRLFSFSVDFPTGPLPRSMVHLWPGRLCRRCAVVMSWRGGGQPPTESLPAAPTLHFAAITTHPHTHLCCALAPDPHCIPQSWLGTARHVPHASTHPQGRAFRGFRRGKEEERRRRRRREHTRHRVWTCSPRQAGIPSWITLPGWRLSESGGGAVVSIGFVGIGTPSKAGGCILARQQSSGLSIEPAPHFVHPAGPEPRDTDDQGTNKTKPTPTQHTHDDGSRGCTPTKPTPHTNSSHYGATGYAGAPGGGRRAAPEQRRRCLRAAFGRQAPLRLWLWQQWQQHRAAGQSVVSVG